MKSPGNEHFGLDILLECCQDKHLYIRYSIVSERFISETECTQNFCQHTNTRAFLNRYKDIIADDVLHSQMKDLLVVSRFIDQDRILVDEWFQTFRQLNIMQYCRKYCYIREQQLRDTSDRLGPYYVPSQLYLRTRVTRADSATFIATQAKLNLLRLTDWLDMTSFAIAIATATCAFVKQKMWIHQTGQLFIQLFINIQHLLLFQYIHFSLAKEINLINEKFTKDDNEPYFTEAMSNVTVQVGRPVKFQCIVANLGNHQVAWFRKDKHTLLALGNEVILKNNRILVSNHTDKIFYLTIFAVREEDRGEYMCQINSSPQIDQSAFLKVTVPPHFIEELTSSDTDVNEGDSVSLRCIAKGFPTPYHHHHYHYHHHFHLQVIIRM
uniref:Ig-like domain-containing protein n=1 Tax=Tetranychus urticae TaxID=32264 RepID=T1KMM9_TETUR